MASTTKTVGYFLRQANISISRALTRRLSAYNLTSPQIIFMREVWIEEGLSQRELSARVGTAESTTVSALRVLERRKLIKRIAKPNDRRAIRVYLTPTGRQLQHDVVPKIQEVNQLLVRGISPKDLEAFSRALSKIQENADALAARVARPRADSD
jgi:DNA-binding MarR family transcriptional regulator